MDRTPRRLHGVLLVSCLYAASLCRASPAATCVGDCNGNNTVKADELVTQVAIALGNSPVSACMAGDVGQDAQITIDEIVTAVNSALPGCPPQPVSLHAAVHFGQPQEPINQQLVGTVQSSPLADANQLLNTAVHPPSMRLDVGFEDVPTAQWPAH